MQFISRRRRWVLGAIALMAIILMTILAAPANNKLNSGSTYSRSPDGYGAWYAFMAKRGTPVQRWQKSSEDFIEAHQSDTPSTLVRIYPQLLPKWFSSILPEQQWVAKGNTLILLGIDRSVTAAPFSTLQNSPWGKITIDTRRRETTVSETLTLLGDRFGAVVWREKMGKGELILVTTPHLAANAYQDFPSNYNYLAKLATRSGNQIWVDEYIHGYKDIETITSEIAGDFWSYLRQTPLSAVLIQILILLAIIIWASNRRLGKPVVISTPVVDNSQAYIEALAMILQKAGSREFVVSAIAQEEQKQLQKALGLDDKSIDAQILIDAWGQATGKPPKDLESLLQFSAKKQPINDADLLIWLEKWQQIRTK